MHTGGSLRQSSERNFIGMLRIVRECTGPFLVQYIDDIGMLLFDFFDRLKKKQDMSQWYYLNRSMRRLI